MASFQPAPLSILRVGAVLGSPIYDPSDSRTKLLSAGVAITEELLFRLRQRGVGTVALTDSDLAKLSAFRPQGTATESPLNHEYVVSPLETKASRELDEAVDEGESLIVSPEEAFLAQDDKPATEGYDDDAVSEMAEQNEQRVTYLEGLFRDLVQSKSSADLEPCDGICQDSLGAAARDLDQFVCLGANPFSSDYPHRHSLHTACLAIAIGAKLGLGELALIDLARGCLIHDLGMLRIPNEPYKLTRTLTNHEIKGSSGLSVLW